jgi:3-hydroxymyristoyl/3-hydroxydecanoyl-(acyl carrier protein) dehydratase
MNSDFRSTVEQSIRKITKTAEGFEAEVIFSPAAPIFQGHFPGNPIVPAVYQLALCRLLAEKYLLGKFKQVSRSRFSAPCVPDVLYNAMVSFEETAESCCATCSLRQAGLQAGVIHSKIVLLYEKQASPG